MKDKQPIKFESSFPKGSDPYKIEKEIFEALQEVALPPQLIIKNEQAGKKNN